MPLHATVAVLEKNRGGQGFFIQELLSFGLDFLFQTVRLTLSQCLRLHLPAEPLHYEAYI